MELAAERSGELSSQLGRQAVERQEKARSCGVAAACWRALVCGDKPGAGRLPLPLLKTVNELAGPRDLVEGGCSLGLVGRMPGRCPQARREPAKLWENGRPRGRLLAKGRSPGGGQPRHQHQQAAPACHSLRRSIITRAHQPSRRGGAASRAEEGCV